jgi:hypothetical protein
MNNAPRHWPLVAFLSEIGRVESYRQLLYLSYLLGRQVPLAYAFSVPPCLESLQLRADLDRLASRGQIRMEFHRVWILEITRRGKNSFARMKEELPRKWLRSLRGLVQECSGSSYLQQLEQLSKETLKSGSVLLPEKNLMEDIKDLTVQLEKSPPSHNRLMLEGSLDYLILALRKIRRIPRRAQLLASANCYIAQVQRIRGLVAMNYEVLGELDLRDLQEEFELLEGAFRETAKLPLVEERHDLSLFAEV